MSAIGVGLGIAGQLVGADAAGPGPVTVDDLVPILRQIEYRFNVINDVFMDADSDSTASITDASEAATQLEVIGQDVKDTTERIVDTIIPHSLSWLSGYLVSHFIAPMQTDIAKLKVQVASLFGEVATLDLWRKEYVDPNVELWVGFRQFFDGWPQSILFTWHDWLENPSHFADWAAAPLIGPLVAYLADASHSESRDNLAKIMVDAWYEEPTVVWDGVMAWLLAEG